jgi:hypothetical protein
MEKKGRSAFLKQGSVLLKNVVDKLSLQHPDFPEKTFVVVISHDCDLANEQEDSFEVIIGRVLDENELNGNFTHTKNVRKLHIEFKNGSEIIFVELLTGKHKLLKDSLQSQVCTSPHCLDVKNLEILQRWLAARYRRSAFPDEFNNRLKKFKIEDKLKKILESQGVFILSILFDLDDGKNIERNGDEDIYELSIYLVYESHNFDVAHDVAKSVTEKIKGLFEKKFCGIELIDCQVISDEVLTVKYARVLREWRLEYLSLRDDPMQTMLE